VGPGRRGGEGSGGERRSGRVLLDGRVLQKDQHREQALLDVKQATLREVAGALENGFAAEVQTRDQSRDAVPALFGGADPLENPCEQGFMRGTGVRLGRGLEGERDRAFRGDRWGGGPAAGAQQVTTFSARDLDPALRAAFHHPAQKHGADAEGVNDGFASAVAVSREVRVDVFEVGVAGAVEFAGEDVVHARHEGDTAACEQRVKFLANRGFADAALRAQGCQQLQGRHAAPRALEEVQGAVRVHKLSLTNDVSACLTRWGYCLDCCLRRKIREVGGGLSP
jgi:hypothetical protein